MKEICFNCLIILVICLSGTYSQNGPAQQKFSLPVASIPIPVRHPLQYRNERLVAGGPNAGLVRIRRPLLAARQNHLNGLTQSNLAEEAKPVTEDPESEENQSYFVSQQQQHQVQQQPHLPAILYSTDENGEILDSNRGIELSTTRFNPPQERIVPTTIRTTGAQRYSLNQDRPQNVEPKPLRARPEYREPRPQFEPNRQEVVHNVRRPQPEIVSKPRLQHQNQEREKKPVAQILRKYREENEDGTITWGFENDDGSFKEEIIGIDCVTRGRYGYIDPDGLKREYNYETGNLCDPNKRDQEEEDQQNDGPQDDGAYVDYQENQMVLPNGNRINLSDIGKNKSRRPIYTN